MRFYQKCFLIFALCICLSGISLHQVFSQPWMSYPLFVPWGYNMFFPPYSPYFPASNRFLLPQLPPPAPIVTASTPRLPHATIIVSTGITAVSPAPGVLVIGSTTALASPTVVSTTPTTATTVPAPAPLLSILATIYASSLYAPALLSTANPLLFAYLSSLII
ncbi:MAG: hypothetical protein ACMUIA_08100 [bacterium]